MTQQPQPSPDSLSPGKDSPSPETSSPERGKSRWLILFKPKVGIPLAILFVLAMIPLAYRSWRISSLPPIDEPFDVEAFCAETIPDEENAFVEYREALDLFVTDTATVEEWGVQDDLYRGRWEHAPAAFTIWISDNEQSVEKWLEGTRKPDAMAVPRNQLSHTGDEYPDAVRALARLVVMKAGRHLYRNETDEAWSTIYGLFRSSRHLGQNAPTHGRLLGLAFHAMSMPCIVSWSGHSRTNATDIHQAMSYLARDYATMTHPFSVTLKYEHLLLKECLSSHNYRGFVFDSNPLLDNATIFVMGEPEFSESLLRHVLKNQLEGVDCELAARPPFVLDNARLFDIAASASRPASGKELADLMNIPSMIEGLHVIPFLEYLLEAGDRERFRQATMMAVLAVQHFVRLHGRFPETLEECETVESQEPFPDPWRRHYHPLIYRTDGEFAVVYSIGSDGTDDTYTPQPPDDKQQASWSELSNADYMTEGYRIPLWRPESDETVDQEASVVPDNVQD